MKKAFLVLALVAVYGVSMAMSESAVVTVNESKTTIVAVDDNNTPAAEKEKAKETKAASTDGKAKSEGCGTAKSEGCGTAKSAGCGDKAKTESTEKKEGSK